MADARNTDHTPAMPGGIKANFGTETE